MVLSEKTLICIPALNEELNIQNTLSSLMEYVESSNILVVDDGSTDRTGSIAKGLGVNVITLGSNLGVGAAMRVGFIFAHSYGYERIIQFDADGQHDCTFLDVIEDALRHNDVVVGSRFSLDKSYKVSAFRFLAMRFLSIGVRILTGQRLTDVTSGFRGTGQRGIAVFADLYPSEYLGDTVESLFIAYNHGLSIAEVPVKMNQRTLGVASNGPIKSAYSLLRVVATFTVFAISTLLGRKKSNA